jgi:hypothetical protein
MTRQIRGEERAKLGADLRSRYEAGSTLAELGAAAGRSPGNIAFLLREAGATIRPAAPRPTCTEAQDAEIARLYRQWNALRDVACKTGLSLYVITQSLARQGINRREGRKTSIMRHPDARRLQLARSGQPNLYTCVKPWCGERIADRETGLCMKHRASPDRRPCQRCRQELDTQRLWLCSSCHDTGWRRCSIGGHILPVALMRDNSRCRECFRDRRGSIRCKRCGEWANTRGTRNTICADCWEGVPGCLDHSGECSQSSGRLIAGRCQVHYIRQRAAKPRPG